MKILLDFNAEVGREDIFKPTTENDSSDKISNDNGEANLATSKHLTVKSTMFPHHNIHNLLGNLVMERHTIILTTF
jgi:hypothetical protein